jgi:uncharacterized protein (TIGR00299 family) protein
MKIAYFDTFSGVSGDMTLGAFISAGVPLDALREGIALLGLRGVELEASHVVRNGITAVKLDVVISAPGKKHRHLSDIMELIAGSGLSARVRDDAARIFTEVGKAEAKVHNTSIEKVHFHEVGALDSIVDIVGAALCMELAGIERVYSSPVRLGSGGFVDTDHGRLPLPGPAAAEILRGYPTVLTGIPFELTTPTGAAIIRALSSGTLAEERMTVSEIGYGAGTHEIPQAPNLLRILIGEMSAGEAGGMVLIETAIDDMNPELYPFVIERLLEAGAADAYLVPVIMKKGRPGIVLTVLSDASLADSLTPIIFSHTTTLGIRMHQVSRIALPRSARTIRTSFGEVTVKSIVARGDERLVPEFEECKRIALRENLSIVEVYRRIGEEAGGPKKG